VENIKSKTINALKWSALERFLAQGMQLLIMLLLARILGPESFGLIGMLAVFISISQVLVDSGFSSALIRKQDRSDADFSTAFYFNIFVSVVCYSALYISSPSIAHFYNQPLLIDLARVLGVVMIVNSFGLVPKTILTINMNFKAQALISIISILISSIVSIFLAYKGFGVWSLVSQSVITAALNVILINLTIRWSPSFIFSKSSLQYLFGFGGKLLLAGLLESFYNNIYQIVIGKKFNAFQLGQFTQANQLASVPAITMTNVIQRVTYPMLSHIQHDVEKMDKAYILSMRIAAVFIFPLMSGLCIISKPLLILLLGNEWEPSALLVSLLALGYMLYPIHAINLNLLQVKGRSDLFLKLEIIKKILATLILCFTIPYGVQMMCLGIVLHSYASLVINTYYTGTLSSLTAARQIKVIMPIWLISVGSGSFTLIISSFFLESNVSKIILMLFLTPVVYLTLIFLLQKDLFIKILSMRNH